jgi:hypothetical protein
MGVSQQTTDQPVKTLFLSKIFSKKLETTRSMHFAIIQQHKSIYLQGAKGITLVGIWPTWPACCCCCWKKLEVAKTQFLET